MKHFKIKICGITRPQDAKQACRLGTDFIGLIFYKKSPRLVSLTRAKEIVKEIDPTVAIVGVFVDQTADEMLGIATKLNLNFIQLHGHESVKVIHQLKSYKFKVINVVNIIKKSDYEALKSSKADLLMIDNQTTVLKGGTGQQFDWSLRPKFKIKNLALSGGLNEKNLSEGIRIFQPLLVDINSGVESRPGIKSKKKLISFFEKANRLRYGQNK